MEGDNAAGLRADIATANKRIDELEDQRRAINADIEAVVSGLEGQGINRHALRHARKMAKADDSQRAAFDSSLALVREALRIGEQLAMGLGE